MKKLTKKIAYIPLFGLGALALASCIKSSAVVEKVELSGNIADALTSDDPISSTGTDNILVVPLKFNSNGYEYTDSMKDTLNKAFTGTCEETGYYSLKEYINVSSYQKLSLDINVLDAVETSYIDISNYTNMITDSFERLSSVENLSNYDKDSDSYIDSIYFVYTSTTDSSKSYTYYERATYNFTKFVNQSLTGTSYKIGNVSFVDYYTFTKNYESNYTATSINVDSHELVHQFGYQLGLTDMNDNGYTPDGYSGYTEYARGEMGITMMSGTAGDFSSHDKMLLGWATVYAASGDFSVTQSISSFEQGGEVIIWSDHTVTSVFDEYFVFEILSNELLNSDKVVPNVKNDDAYYVLKLSHINAILRTNSNGKAVKGSGTNKTAFLYDNKSTDYFRNNLIISNEYTSEATLTKAYFFQKTDLQTFSPKFINTNKVQSLTFGLADITDDNLCIIKLVL